MIHRHRFSALLTLAVVGLCPLVLVGQTAQETAPAPKPKIEYTQKDAPAEVDQALRARVNEFFQYHVDGKLIKAFDIVAEDTKEEYFASAKMEILDFRIDDIQYSEDFQNALVTLVVKRVWGFHAQETDVTLPMVTTWKIEDGQWVWYHDKGRDSITPMGLSNRENMPVLISQNEDGSINLPKDFSPEVMAAAFQEIMQKTEVNKTEVTLSRTAASEDTFVLHNANPGSLGVEIGAYPEKPGLTIQADRPMVNANEDIVVTVRYAPPAELKDGDSPTDFQFNIGTVPLNQTFRLTVRFE